jgi:hypothetical protein
MRQWLWGLQFLRECTPARTRHNIEQIVRLGTYSRDTLQQLRRDTGIAVRPAHAGHPALLHQPEGVRRRRRPRPRRCARWAATAA